MKRFLSNKIINKFIDKLFSHSKILIIPHWDVDGVASAAILLEILEENGLNVDVAFPKIGYYDYEALPHNEIMMNNYDAIILVDYALDKGVIRSIHCNYNFDVLVIDHHINQLPKNPSYLNPYIYGLNLNDYPSTTWVIHEIFNIPLNLKVVLGFVGDLDVRAKTHKYWKIVESIANSNNWDVNKIYLLKNYIDSCYQTYNYYLLKYSVHKLCEYGDSLNLALKDDNWRKTYDEVNREIKKFISSYSKQIINSGILLYEISSKYLIFSYLGRLYAQEYPDKIIIVWFKSENLSLLYVRSYKYDLSRIIKYLKKLGYDVGGKENVFSIILQSRDDTENEETLNLLIKLLKDLIR